MLSAQSPFGLGHLHALPGSGPNQIRLELGNHGQYVEKKSSDRVVRIMDGSADAEFHILGGEFVDDVFRISKGACQPVEFGDDQRVTRAAGGECLAQTRSRTVRTGQTVICVDQRGSDSESFEGILLSRQVLFVRGYAGIPD